MGIQLTAYSIHFRLDRNKLPCQLKQEEKIHLCLEYFLTHMGTIIMPDSTILGGKSCRFSMELCCMQDRGALFNAGMAHLTLRNADDGD